MMKKELYFEVGAEGGGEELYRITDASGIISFCVLHDTYDADKDEVFNIKKSYPTFEEYLNKFLQYEEWYLLHPLFIHDEIKPVFNNLVQTNVPSPESEEFWLQYIRPSWQRALENRK